jgi:hypothetical protein
LLSGLSVPGSLAFRKYLNLEKGASVMKSVSFARACCLGLSGLAVLVTSVGPSWAGMPVPAPLVGVTGPFGLLAAGAAYGSYLLYKRFQNRG